MIELNCVSLRKIKDSKSKNNLIIITIIIASDPTHSLSLALRVKRNTILIGENEEEKENMKTKWRNIILFCCMCILYIFNKKHIYIVIFSLSYFVGLSPLLIIHIRAHTKQKQYFIKCALSYHYVCSPLIYEFIMLIYARKSRIIS